MSSIVTPSNVKNRASVREWLRVGAQRGGFEKRTENTLILKSTGARLRGRTLQGGVLGTFWKLLLKTASENPCQNPFLTVKPILRTLLRTLLQNPSSEPFPEPSQNPSQNAVLPYDPSCTQIKGIQAFLRHYWGIFHGSSAMKMHEECLKNLIFKSVKSGSIQVENGILKSLLLCPRPLPSFTSGSN